MHRLVAASLAAGLSVGLTAATSAADLGRPEPAPIYTKAPLAPAPYSWTGFYVGANVGYGWGESTGDLDPNFPTSNNAVGAVNGGFIQSHLGVKPAGFIGGGQLGYNWQDGSWVWGLEADLQGSGIKDSKTILFPGSALLVPSTTVASDKLDWFGTVRPRAGFLVTPGVLLYGTGGLAYGDVKASVQETGNPIAAGSFGGATNETRVGWTVGAGVEWKVTNNISVKAEYLHVDLGTTTVHTVDPVNFPTNFFDYKFKNVDEIARGGINYKF